MYAIAAVGLTTQPKFIGLAVFISLNVAVSAIVARRKGEGNRESANKVLQQALLITGGLLVVVSTLCVAFADLILHLAGSQPDTHRPAVTYFRIVMGGMAFNVVSMVINAAQRGAGNTRSPDHQSGVQPGQRRVRLSSHRRAFRLPGPGRCRRGDRHRHRLGMRMRAEHPLDAPPGQFHLHPGSQKIGFDKATVRAITNIGSSTLAEQAFLRIGFMTFAVIVARLGTIPMAAHQIGMNLMSICFSFGDGLSVASVALSGRALEAGPTSPGYTATSASGADCCSPAACR